MVQPDVTYHNEEDGIPGHERQLDRCFPRDSLESSQSCKMARERVSSIGLCLTRFLLVK
jgi:hypothetical protein